MKKNTDNKKFPNYMKNNSPKGTKIIFTANGGWQIEIDDAKNKLKLGKVYTVESVRIGDWCSYVTLKEFEGKEFNTSLFEKGEN